MRILVIDIETTGFKHARDKIVEVGICSLNLASGEIKPVFDSIVKEEGFSVEEHGNAWIFRNSDLEASSVENAGNLDLLVLQEKLDLEVATSWNTDFDFGFLESRGLKVGLLNCPMKGSTEYFKLPGVNGNKYKYPSVQEAWNILFPGEKFGEKHRAYDDAVHEAMIIFELYKKKCGGQNERGFTVV